MEIIPYTEDLIPAVKNMNRRLKTGGAAWAFFETPHPMPQFRNPHGKVFVETFLAVEHGVVRGAYALKHQDFWINGKEISIAVYSLPISEGIINHKYGMVAVRLLAHARSRQPLLIGLGMGGFHENLPRFLKASRWSMWEIPFYFKVIHPYHFLKNINVLRTAPWRQSALDLLAVSGLGWIGIKALHAFSKSTRVSPDLSVRAVRAFPSSVDSLWEEYKAVCSLMSVRDMRVLDRLYPESDAENIKLLFFFRGKLVGWTVVRNTIMRKHKQFGNMCVGSLVDGLVLPRYVDQVVCAVAKFFVHQKADIVVSNQCNLGWCEAMNGAGFRRGPSNFIFAVSPALANIIGGSDQERQRWHINRGDGDGPINL